MRILICGASGFIGRNLFEQLSINPELEVYGTFLNKKGCAENSSYPRLRRADFTDMEIARTVTYGFDYIINAAAMTDGMGAVVNNPAGYIADNVLINTNLIRSAYENQVKHFIFLSCTVMYPSGKRPLKEHEHNLNTVHPKYFMGARMKVFSEDLCRFYAELGNTKYTAVRHSNIYGPHDKFDLQKGHVLSATIEKVLQAKNEITVWGDGNESRDFLYIDDLINFIIKAIEKQENNFEIFNVGYGKTCSIKELVKKIVFCSGKKLDIIYDLSKPTVATHMNIDIEKAKRLLNWKAEIGLSEGLLKTIDWYKNNPR